MATSSGSHADASPPSAAAAAAAAGQPSSVSLREALFGSAPPGSPFRHRRLRLRRPAVFSGLARSWPALGWSPAALAEMLGERRLVFRVGPKRRAPAAVGEAREPRFETECAQVVATAAEFVAWANHDGVDDGGLGGGAASEVARRAADAGALSEVSRRDYWVYADYMHMALLFRDDPDLLKGLRWEELGFPGRFGAESTLWLGSEGANTPCHLDTYGFNLVLQIHGRKRWHLFPPGDTRLLRPTRVPYEESSVFSRVHPVTPDLRRSPGFGRARRYCVTLQPGQILFVPPRWWHYVESVDRATVSANTWVELDSDHDARLEEALARVIVCAVKTQPHADNLPRWLNPSEDDDISYETNLRYLNAALAALPASPPSHAGAELRVASRRGGRKRSADESELDGNSDCNRHPDRDHRPTESESPSEGGGAPSMPRGAFLVPLDTASGPPALDSEAEARESREVVAVDTDTLLECVAHPDVVGAIARLLRQRLNV